MSSVGYGPLRAIGGSGFVWLVCFVFNLKLYLNHIVPSNLVACLTTSRSFGTTEKAKYSTI